MSGEGIFNPFAKQEQDLSKNDRALVRDFLGEEGARAFTEATGIGEMGHDQLVEDEGSEAQGLAEIERDVEGIRTFRLKDVPYFDVLPAYQELKQDYHLNQAQIGVWEGAPLDSQLRDEDLIDLGLSQEIRVSIISSLKKRHERCEAAIFDIGELFDKRNVFHLPIKEVYEAIDAAGFRPATFFELLAFARDYWQPGGGLGDKLVLQKRLYASPLTALGSCFTRFNGSRRRAYLTDSESEIRGLYDESMSSDTFHHSYFLVVLK